MAGVACGVMRLLLFYFIRAGLKGDDVLIFAELGFNITIPCEDDLVCFYAWPFSTSKTSDYIAMVTNEETANPEDEDSECTHQIKDLTHENVGRHRCQKRLDDFSPDNSAKKNVVGLAVGAVGCVVLTALVALFVVNRRRRTRNQLPEESYTTNTNIVMNEDDLIYADVILPVDFDQVWDGERDSTEYACVRYK